MNKLTKQNMKQTSLIQEHANIKHETKFISYSQSDNGRNNVMNLDLRTLI